VLSLEAKQDGGCRVNEEERAKRLSDAIDVMLQGGQPEADLDDDDLIELMRIARRRYQAGRARAADALASEELVWRVLKARILARRMKQEPEAEEEEEPPL
jgi:hypothetical protein